MVSSVRYTEKGDALKKQLNPKTPPRKSYLHLPFRRDEALKKHPEVNVFFTQLLPSQFQLKMLKRIF